MTAQPSSLAPTPPAAADTPPPVGKLAHGHAGVNPEHYYRPPTVLVNDYARLLACWVGPDADRGMAAIALSCNPSLAALSQEMRDAVLERFGVDRDPVPGKDWLQ